MGAVNLNTRDVGPAWKHHTIAAWIQTSNNGFTVQTDKPPYNQRMLI